MRTTQEIIELVAYGLNLNAYELRHTRSRERRFTEARQIIFYILRNKKKKTLWQIANHFERDHTSVINSLKKFKRDYFGNYKDFRIKADSILLEYEQAEKFGEVTII